MVALALFAALVGTVAAAYVHDYALGVRQVEAKLVAIVKADARRSTDT